MLKYINADDFRKKLIDRQITTQFFNPRERHEIGCIVEMLDNAPAADVVSKSEMEKLQEVIFKKEDLMQEIAKERNAYFDELEALKDTNEHLAVLLSESKSETKREIGEEIYRIIGECHNETWICLLIRELADNLTGKGEALNAETCVVCGDVIPEGRQVCPNCERRDIKNKAL